MAFGVPSASVIAGRFLGVRLISARDVGRKGNIGDGFQ
jgi:hypothetical protein